MKQNAGSWLRAFSRFSRDQKPYRTRLDREFANLTSYTVLAEDGSPVQAFRYTGTYYELLLDGAQKHRFKIFLPVLLLLSCGAFAASALWNTTSNFCRYVIAFQGAAVILFVFAAVYLVFSLCGASCLRDFEYRQQVILPRRIYLLLFVTLLGNLAGKIIFLTAHAQAVAPGEAYSLFFAGTSVCFALALYRIHRRAPYRPIPPETENEDSPVRSIEKERI